MMHAFHNAGDRGQPTIFPSPFSVTRIASGVTASSTITSAAAKHEMLHNTSIPNTQQSQPMVAKAIDEQVKTPTLDCGEIYSNLS